MNRQLLFLFLFCLLSDISLFAQDVARQWTVSQSQQWATSNEWYCGVNYIPANAVNYTAMWDKTSYSPDVIKRELRLMGELGMNCVRFVMQYAVYESNPKRFIRVLDDFLSICDKEGIKAMPIFFDDCIFGANNNPKAGVQPEPLEGWYAWAWSPSPGLSMVIDQRTYPKLEKYVKDVMSHFRSDDRIMMWDLYNEPTNNALGNYSWPLLRSVFQWAREVNPSQPISSGMWNDNKELNEFLASNSDVITFHIYGSTEPTLAWIRRALAYGRPAICTEWMNRTRGSNVKDLLHVFAENKVGCLSWGLVNGKTQTHLPWGHRPDMLPYNGVWQHDLFHGDFSPYDKEELELIAKTIHTMNNPVMMYEDTTRIGLPYAKDPHVVLFNNKYLMYYTIPPLRWNDPRGWNIGIAESEDLVCWKKVGEVTPLAGLSYESNGLCAPCALVKDGVVHLFYQTYGNMAKDAICHAVSTDGINFVRDKTNPVFHPLASEWSCGRAIDAEVIKYKGRYFMYFATRDPEYKIQKLGVAVADGDTDFSRSSWTLAADESILFPELPWEGECIEGPSAYVHKGKLYLFYAGAYNNAPQQIGLAVSKDGIHFSRLSDKPFKANGAPGEWNSSESGHPHLFAPGDGRTYLFYQGNNDSGRTWKITNEEIIWTNKGPRFVE